MNMGIVGALSPLGQSLVQIMRESGNCKLLFTVDGGYENNSRARGEYRTIDAAVAAQYGAAFVIIDVMDDGQFKERAKLYRFYGIPAIVGGAELSEQDIAALEKGYSVRRRTFAPVVIEPSLITGAAQSAFAAVGKLVHWLYMQPFKVVKQVYYNILPKINVASS